MKQLLVLLLAFAGCLALAQDDIKPDEDGWTNIEFLNGLVKLRAPFDLDEDEAADCTILVTNDKDQVKSSVYLGKDEKVACAMAIFESDKEKLKIDLSNTSKDNDDDSWFKAVKSSYRTTKKDGWTCISGESRLENGGSVFIRLFYSDHKAIAFAVFCQDAKDAETKKTKKQIVDSFVFDIKAEKKELESK